MGFLKDNLLEIIAIVISLFSVWYTFYTSDRFGLKSKIYEKKLFITLDLLETIKSLSFGYSIKTINESMGAGRFTIKKDMGHFKDEIEIFKDAKLYLDFEESHLMFKKIISLKNNPYMPQNIAYAMDFLETSYHFIENPESLDNYAVITLGNYKKNKHLVSLVSVKNFGDFISQMKNILVEIERWIEKETSLRNQIRI